MPPFFLEEWMKTLLFYTFQEMAYTAFARFSNINRKGMNGDEVREATTIIGQIAGTASWNILAGDWNRTHTRFTLWNGRPFIFHPKFNEICAALEREYEQLRGHARYRRDRNPLHSEDGLLVQGTGYIYASRKERKYRSEFSYEGRTDEQGNYHVSLRPYLLIQNGDREGTKLAEAEIPSGRVPGSGAIYAS
jgi:hypothetical protein